MTTNEENKKQRKVYFEVYEEDGKIGLEQKETKIGFLEKSAIIVALAQLIDQLSRMSLELNNLLKESIEKAYDGLSSGQIDEDDVDPLSMLTILKKVVE